MGHGQGAVRDPVRRSLPARLNLMINPWPAHGIPDSPRARGLEHRKTRPYTPRTNGTVERCNGRVQREVLGLTVASHRDLERLLKGFNAAYNARRQRVLGRRS